MNISTDFEYDYLRIAPHDAGFRAYLSSTYGHRMLRVHMHPFHELLIRRGNEPATYFSLTHPTVIDQPAIIFFRAATAHKCVADEQHLYVRTVCYFTDEYLQGFREASSIFSQEKFSSDCIIFPIPEPFRTDIFRIADALSDKEVPPTRKRLLFARLLEFISHSLPPLESYTTKNRSSYSVRLLEYVTKHYASNLQREDVAEHFHISLAKLDRDFSALTSMSMQQYLITLRIHHAIAFLYEQIPIEEVAQRCGFKSTKYFRQVFKSRTGITPMQFRTFLKNNKIK